MWRSEICDRGSNAPSKQRRRVPLFNAESPANQERLSITSVRETQLPPQYVPSRRSSRKSPRPCRGSGAWECPPYLRIKYGVPSEVIAHELWEEHEKLAFASSANPSGKGNSGHITGIGERIHNEADLVIAGGRVCPLDSTRCE
jgi:hypothetical protein